MSFAQNAKALGRMKAEGFDDCHQIARIEVLARDSSIACHFLPHRNTAPCCGTLHVPAGQRWWAGQRTGTKMKFFFLKLYYAGGGDSRVKR